MSSLRWQILLLDHDDTVVDSTEKIHYPAHVAAVKKLRPDLEPVSFEGWISKCHDPGVGVYNAQLFNREDRTAETEIWRSFTTTMIPDFYEGMLDLLREYVDRGGKIFVVSQSDEDIIRKHYAHAGAEHLLEGVYGRGEDPKLRKPSPAPALSALEKTGIPAARALVVDDLASGVQMAKAAGIQVVGAGWGHNVPEVREYMLANCDMFCNEVAELRNILLQPAQESRL
mmetsp:Transcript_14907/g.33972  ORF Transcript_14907/g.33972 Transcript_14907/m.33972 type:complete len:228 (-) Transcript_14907:50-733(-)